MTIEEMIKDPECWVNKIICRYEEGHPAKIYLREGEDLILLSEVKRLRSLLSEIDRDNI